MTQIIFHLRVLILFCFTLSCFGYCEEAKNTESKYQYDLSIAAIFQDEAPYIKEWIEFHKLVGVQHFYLFNNLSHDDYKSVLEPYIKRGEVDLIEWPCESPTILDWRALQPRAYRQALDLARGKTRWLAVLDLDEFLFAVNEDNLVRFLDSQFMHFGGVCVNQQIYGTSGIPNIPQGNLMIELLLYKAPTKAASNLYYKSIVRPECVAWCDNPHFFHYTPGYFPVNAIKEQVIEKTGINTGIYVDEIRINHYWTRDEFHFQKVKIPRVLRRDSKFTPEMLMQTAEQYSEQYDPAILRFVPRLKRVMKYKR